MARIPDNIVDQIFQETDLLALVKETVPVMKKAGGSLWKGLSPFNNEDSPSFFVNVSKRNWHCYSADKGGNAAGFLMETKGMDYRKALEYLAEKANITIPQNNVDKEKLQETEEITKLNESASKFFMIQEGDYWKGRSFDKEVCQRWLLGYTGQTGTSLTESLETTGLFHRAEKAGLVKSNQRGHYDFFRRRAMIGIHDHYGKLVGFAGRCLEGGKAKYINTSDESPLYNKSRLLYGLHQAIPHILKLGFVILVEGYTDVIALHEAGFKNVVATCGTSLTEGHLKLLARYTREVVIIRDGDKAGKKATLRDIDLLLSHNFEIEGLRLPNGQDPDEFILENSPGAFEDVLANRMTWFELASAIHEDGKDLSKPSAKVKVAKLLKGHIKNIPEELEQNIFITEIEKRYASKKGSKDEPSDEPGNNQPEEGTSGSEGSTRNDDSSNHTDQLQLKGNRSWAHYQALKDLIGADSNPDFIPVHQGKTIEVHFFDIKGSPHQVTNNGNRAQARLKLGTHEQVNSIYIPPRLRDEKDSPADKYKTKILTLTQCPVTAWMLTELGLPAVAILIPLGFGSRAGRKEPHSLLKQVINKHEFNELVYALSHRAFSLPPTNVRAGEDPYLNQDAAVMAEETVSAMGYLQQCFRRMPIDGICPVDKNHQANPFWIDNRIIELAKRHEGSKMQRAKIREDLDIYVDELNLYRFSISAGTPHTYRTAVFCSEVGEFFNYHGIHKLGKVFQFGKMIYEYDLITKKITQKENADEVFATWSNRGSYWARSRSEGARMISDFTMKYMLEVKEDDSYTVVEFTGINGQSKKQMIRHSQVINCDQFKKYVADIEGGCYNYWGSKGELEQIHAQERRASREAVSLNKIIGLDRRHGVYVYGNGILTPQGEFVPANEDGSVGFGGATYFIPAAAEFLPHHMQDSLRSEQQFEYQKSEVTLKEYVQQAIVVHGRGAATGIMFIIAGLYRDFYKNKQIVGKFPHLSLVGQTSAGKSVLLDTLAYLFGDIPQTNLRTKVTKAAFERKISLYRNAIIMLNEFNLDNQIVRQWGLADYLVGLYDWQGGEKTQDDKSRQTLPESAVITAGQMGFEHADALFKRVIVEWLPPRPKIVPIKDQQELDKLRDLGARGISHAIAPLFAARPIVKSKLRSTIKSIKKKISGHDIIQRKAEPRTVENWAIAMAPLFILMDEHVVDWVYSKQEMIDYAVKRCVEHTEQMQNSGVLAMLFAFIQREYGPGKSLSHQDVFPVYKMGALKEVRLHMGNVAYEFNKYLIRNSHSVENTSKADLISRIQAHESFIRLTKSIDSIQVGYKIGERNIIVHKNNKRPAPRIAKGGILCLDPSKVEDFQIPEIDWLALKSDELDSAVDERLEKYEDPEPIAA